MPASSRQKSVILPPEYVTLGEKVASAIPREGSVNKSGSWRKSHPRWNAASSALLKYHWDSRSLGPEEMVYFREMWETSVLLPMESSVSTCTGRMEDGQQCDVDANEVATGLCEAHRDQDGTNEEPGGAQEASCQVCHGDFEEDDLSVACVMCDQKIHGGCWDKSFKDARLATPDIEEVKATLCGLCVCLRPALFTIVAEVSTLRNIKVQVLPLTALQISRAAELNGRPWIAECYDGLAQESAQGKSDAPPYVLFAGARLKEPKNTGFQKHVTSKKAGKEPAPKNAPPKKGKRKDPQPAPASVSEPSEDDDDSDDSSDSAPSERKSGTGKAGKQAILKLQQELGQIRQQLAEQLGGHLDEIEDQRVYDQISGVAVGVKRGEAGSLVHKNMCEVEPYSGMPSDAWGKRVVELVLDHPDVTGN